MSKPIPIGSRVQMHRDWLRAIGSKTGEIQFARGTLCAIEVEAGWSLGVVKWDDGRTTRVAPCNLSIAGRRESEAKEWNNARVDL